MSRARIETMMGAVVLAVATGFLFTATTGSGMKATADSYNIRADFSDITGVNVGSDVRIGGVKIGTVQSVRLNHETYQAQISMAVEKDITLSEDTTAAIVGESLLGGKFVSLSPGGAEATLKEGGVIEFTQSSVSLEQLLGKFVFSGGGVAAGENKAVDAVTSTTPSPDDVDLKLP
jgi:phospholipid/cholesterol/gamma-HCH transport system substrate-binding protein